MICIGHQLTLDQVFHILRFEADLSRIRIAHNADGTYEVMRVDQERDNG